MGVNPTVMQRFLRVISKPGAKPEIQGSAPTQHVEGEDNNPAGFTSATKAKVLDRWLDRVVVISGSKAVFGIIFIGLVTWAFLGIPYSDLDIWQVLISDIQAIISYLFDSLLVRQQLNQYDDEMLVAVQLKSRLSSHNRMMTKLSQELNKEELVALAAESETSQHRHTADFQTELPSENRFGRFVTAFSHVIGHLISVSIYWITVLVWIGMGPMNDWSNRWQLDMNSASSAAMVFIFSFLANIHERHSAYTKTCLNSIFIVDSALERKLRSLTGDQVDNSVVVIPAPKMNPVQRAIFYYADFVGTLIGIAILVCVIVAWIAIGPALQFNANWWLIIGTYAGLVGMNDGFVLRNMQARLDEYAEVEFATIDKEDEALFHQMRLTTPPRETINESTLTYRVSDIMGRISAHEITVLIGLFIIFGLVAGSSALHWSETGQLLSNVPPSLIETFFMLILITGHNYADERKRANLRNLYERRLRLFSFVSCVELHAQGPAGLEKSAVAVAL
ncbi:Low affinity iron permease-domain-containing protein [Talaromyces proteolyticus]|uniref:Low affinity iron permease-domain-containing protein n=1 Tax=Talaromyces proteolyticus TaxID=1131652 RepID=A0AAD4L2E7_9EURO|nr:Low affinity iron permease-domain-containing protein [Talaromyces proteolyticus]KAH8703299.1 Low affinity iron permease-domain-containing protein [Talaromyces proteolyticus]